MAPPSGLKLGRFRSSSRVTCENLLTEVDEYFSAGASLPPGAVVLDVGANIGAFALRAAQRCPVGLQVHCFEPSPDLFCELERNLRETNAHALAHIRTHRIGISSPEREGTRIPFFYFRNYPTNSTFDLEQKRQEFIQFFFAHGQRLEKRLARRHGRLGALMGGLVRAFVSRTPTLPGVWFLMSRTLGLVEVHADVETLSTVIDRERIEEVDLLKIDVEGSELEVLRGVRSEHWDRIRQVVVETNDLAGTRRGVEAILDAHGFRERRLVAQAASDNGLNSVIIHACRERPLL